MVEMSALALQKAIRGRLISDAGVLALVPAANIFDRHGRPERFPCIILGEGQDVADDITLARRHVRSFATLHLWQREPGTTGVKAIAGAIRKALDAGPITLDEGDLIDLRFEGVRFLRDPDGETAHGAFTVEALIGEAA
jgi:hypothetical protein